MAVSNSTGKEKFKYNNIRDLILAETRGRDNDRNSNRGRSKSRNSNRNISKSRSGLQI